MHRQEEPRARLARLHIGFDLRNCGSIPHLALTHFINAEKDPRFKHDAATEALSVRIQANPSSREKLRNEAALEAVGQFYIPWGGRVYVK